jgi:phage terminase large subunit-like protein
MNDPAGVGNLVTEQMIRVKDPRMFPVLEKIRVTVDPAYGEDEKENGDFYWITIAGYDRFNTEFVLSARYSQTWGGMGFVDQLFAIEKDYPGYERIYIEAEHATFLKTLINLEEAKRGISLRIRWIVRPRYLDKWTRHLCFQARFENGRIFFSSEIPTDAMQEMREQLLRAPYGAHDDFLDTLADQESAQTKMKHDDEATKPDQMVVAPIDQERVVMVMKSFYNHETRRIEGRLVPKQLPADIVKFDDMMA